MLFILDNNKRAIGVITPDLPKSLPYIGGEHIEVIESNLQLLTFTVPANHPQASLLENERYVLYTDLDGKKHLFVIKEIEDVHEETMLKQVHCEHSAIGDLLDQPVRPIEMENWALDSAVTHVLNGTGWELGRQEFMGQETISIDRPMTAREALYHVVSHFAGEIEFEAVFDGTKVKKQLVNIVRKRGQDTKVVFEYGHNVRGVKKVEDTNDLATAMIGIGQDGLTFADITHEMDDRFKRHEDYLYDEEAFKRFNKNGKHRFRVYFNPDINTKALLYKETANALAENNRPRITYSCTIAELERITGYSHKKVRIGDRIIAKDFEYEPALVFEARVVEVRRNLIDPSQDMVTLGDYREITLSTNERINQIQRIIRENQAKWNQVGEQIIKGTVPPVNPKYGQLWIDETDGKNILRKWDGYGWQEVGSVTEDDLIEFENSLNDIEQRTTDTAIVGLVANSNTIQTLFNQKADVEDLADFVTGEQLEGVMDETKLYVDNRIDYTLDEVNVLNSKIDKTAQDIRMEFSSAKGVNMLRNSIGFAEYDFWNVNGTVSVRKDEELEAIGYGSGWYSAYGDSGHIDQTVRTTAGKTYSLSFLLNKTRDALSFADALVEIIMNGSVVAAIGMPTAQGTTNGYMVGVYTFEAVSGEATIRVRFGTNCEATVTALMLNEGEQPFAWNHHSEEVYSTNIVFNQLGIRVRNENTGNYTQITPEEFAGYAYIDGQMQRVFALNDETTEVYELDVEHKINLTPISMRSVNSTNRRGIAFIPNE